MSGGTSLQLECLHMYVGRWLYMEGKVREHGPTCQLEEKN